MSKAVFITGTGTDIGKTYVTGLIVKALHAAGKRAAYYKAAASGNVRREDGTLIVGDAESVNGISGISQPVESMCPYVYEHAYSPHLASQIEGNPVDMGVVKKGFKALCEEYDFITMEGSGGILCPIRTGDVKIQLEDIIKELGLSCVIIADAGLGTINSVVLTVEYMKAHNINIKGIIFNNYHDGNIMEEDNISMCRQMTHIPVIAKVRCGDNDIKADIESLIGLYDEAAV